MRIAVHKALLAFAIGTTLWAAPAMAQQADRKCGTMDALAEMLAANPELAQKMQAIENHTAEYVKARQMGRAQTVSVTIPVVVHVVYRATVPADNISDAQVKSQIDVLNADYNKTNADITKVPSVFAPLAASQQVTFCLAQVDPNGNPTTGIRRVSTTKSSFGTTGDPVKFTSKGGDDAWDASKYLNIWVCNLGRGLLGYAQFPGGAANTDGVVILNTAFGNTGTAAAPYGLGRSATHEVGHWLNLRHIWGDANCGNDFVDDTPTQQTSNFGCPTFPHVTCSNGPNGDMFMNYMDYVDDACMQMFSAGQVARSQATFVAGGGRETFLTSTACQGGPPPPCVVPTALASNSVTSSSATITWASSGAASYKVQYRTAGTNWTSTTSGSNSLPLAGLTASTQYEFQVASVCPDASVTAFSASGFFTTAGLTWCANAGGSTAKEWIAYAAIGTIANTSGGQNAAGYQDFTAQSTNLLPGSSYNVTVRSGFATGYSAREYYRAWIDYNRDGDFLDAGETVFSGSSTSANNITASITVPATATLGATRLRISQKKAAYLAAACTAYGTGAGQVEDYTVIIGSGTARQASGGFAINLAPNPTSDVTILQAALPEGADAATIRVFDLQGRQVYTASDARVDNSRIEGYALPVRDLKPGVYMLRVEAAGMQKTVRLSVQ